MSQITICDWCEEEQAYDRENFLHISDYKVDFCGTKCYELWLEEHPEDER